jgi:hypothetical protein
VSNLYLAVEKVTESLAGNIKVNLSLGLAANDKRREGVARSVGPLLTFLPCPTGTKTSAVYPLQGSFWFQLDVGPFKPIISVSMLRIVCSLHHQWSR